MKKEALGDEINEGKVSDHLANERTFLAWIRTAISIMGFGFVVVKFSLFVRQLSLMVTDKAASIPTKGYSAPAGTFLVALGALISLLAYFRYKQIEKQLKTNSFSPSSALVVILTIFIIAGSIFLLWYLMPNVF